jgi:hypothetical protein
MKHISLPGMLIITICASAFPLQSSSQISISGLPCVVAGGSTGYLYTVTGKVESNDEMEWKVYGGNFVSNNATTLKATIGSMPEIRVVWTAGQSTGSITCSSKLRGSTEFKVKIVSLLNSISSDKKTVKSGTIVTLTGSKPGAGDCSPLIEIWWEKAASEKGPFERIMDALEPDLGNTSITQKSYFRRVLSISCDVFYSNIIMVDIQ